LRSLATGAAVIVAAASYSVSVDAGAEAGNPNAPVTAVHVVQRGETLYRIAKQYGTTVEDLTARNGLPMSGAIRAGQVLAVPLGATPTAALQSQTDLELQAGTVSMHYTVVSGDTLNGIARRFGTSATALASANAIGNPNAIYVGQVIAVPMSTRSGTTGGAPTVAPGVIVDVPLGSPGDPAPTTIPSPVVQPPPPPASAGTLPAALFGSTAKDPARLALIPSFDRWADTYGVPRNLVKGLAFVESGWRANALSSSGAVGIGQLMPDTSRWVATTMLGTPSLDPNKPDDNIRMTARYLRYLLDQTGGDEYTAIGAYYQGLGSIRRDGMKPVTHTYVAKVQTARAHF
jgi:LysM repeat protein